MERAIAPGYLQPLKKDVQNVATMCSAMLNYAPSSKSTEVCPMCGKLRQQLNDLQQQHKQLQQQHRQLQQHHQLLQQQQCFDGEFKLKDLESNDWQLVERTQELQRQRLSQSAAAEVVRVRQQNVELNGQVRELKDTIDHITAQVVTYKEDFETERSDRERAQGTIAELRSQLQQLQQQLQSYQPRPMGSLAYQAPPPSYRTAHNPPQSSPYYLSDQYGDIQLDGEEYHCSTIVPQSQSMQTTQPLGREASHQASDYRFSPKPSRTTDLQGREASHRIADERFSPKPLRSMELTGRGIYQPDTADDETDGPVAPAVCEKMAGSPAQCGKTGQWQASVSQNHNFAVADGPSKCYTRSSGQVGPNAGNSAKASDDFFSLKLAGSEIVQPMVSSREDGDCLRCPKCRKSYNIDEHHLLLDHIEEHMQ